MSLFSIHLRYLQETAWIWKKYNTDESNTLIFLHDLSSFFLHDQLDICWGKLASRGISEELQEQQEILRCYKTEAAIEPQINTNVESFLLVFLFVFIKFFLTRDHQQITFVKTSRFFLLSKTSHPLFLMDNIKLDGMPSKIKWKIHACFTI